MGSFEPRTTRKQAARGAVATPALVTAALAALALAAALTGCRAAPADWLYAAPAMDGPWSLDGEVVYHDPGRERLLIVSESTAGPRRRAVTLEGDRSLTLLAVQASAVGGDALLMLDPAAKTVDVYRAGDTAVTRFDIQAPFTAMRASDDGRAVVLFHSGASSSGGIVNTAEIGLLRLDVAPSDSNPQLTTIAGFSRQPVDATISAPLDGDGGSRRLVWLTASSLLGFADLSPDSEPRGLIVPLAPPESNASITPREVQSVVEDGGDVHLYLVASGSSDMVHIRVRTSATNLDADIDQIASGAEPRDLHVYQTADGPRVLTINRQSRDIAWLDPSTGSGTVVTLETQLDAIVPWIDADGRDRALLWASSGGVAEIALVDVLDLPKRKGKAIERVLVEQAVTAVVPQGSRFLLRHGSSNTGLSIYDATTDKRSTFGSTGSIRSVVEVGGLLYALGDTPGGQQLAALDLQQLSGSSELLEFSGNALMRFGDAGLALQGGDVGGPWLLVLPAAGTSVEGATWLRDLTIDGFLSDGGAS